MEVAENKVQSDMMFQLFKTTGKEDLNYVYRGVFTQNITDGIIALAEKNLDDGEDARLKKRLYFIIVESLQNITRYQADMHELSDRYGIFVIQKREQYYLVTTGNLIDNNKIVYVKEKLEVLNKMTEDELRDYYKVVLRNGTFTDKGGAGLGMIEMARKSGNKLYYNFKKFDENCSFFYFHTIMPTIEEKDRIVLESGHDEYVNFIMELHQSLAHDKVSMVFNCGFNQDSLLSLIGLIESHIQKTGNLKRKFFNVMVEMLQNIIHHGLGDPSYLSKGKPGIFYIEENEKEYMLNSGNYVHNTLIEEFTNRMEQINALKKNELDELYNNKLFDLNTESYKKNGLGMIDIRIKSNSKLIYKFTPATSDYSFFCLRIHLDKGE